MLPQFTPEDRLFALAFIVLHLALMGIRIAFRFAAGDIVRPIVNREEGVGNIAARWALGSLLVAAIVAYFVAPAGAQGVGAGPQGVGADARAAWSWMFVPVPGALRWGGVAGSALAICLLVWAHRTLNDEFSSTLKLSADHHLVTTGPYRLIQHPIYVAFFTHFACTGVYTRSWPIGVLGMLTIGTLMTTRLRREEAMLHGAFEEAYDRYRASTGRFVPRRRRGVRLSPSPSRAPDRGRR